MQVATIDELVLTEEDFCKISDIVYQHCGINLHDGKKELVHARLGKLLRQNNRDSFSDYIESVIDDKSGEKLSEMVDSLSTNLTSFFREDRHFRFIEEILLPRLVQKKKKRNNFRLRGWSAGCSSGQEPYSIAITLLENMPQTEMWDVKLLATDISNRVLEVARKGVYERQQINSVETAIIRKYFVPKDKKEQTYQVADALKKLVVFGYLNLKKDWPIQGPLDFIFCRNVMIYFDKETQQQLISRFWQLLDSGGVLFTGHSESLTSIEHRFEYVQPTIYMKP